MLNSLADTSRDQPAAFLGPQAVGHSLWLDHVARNFLSSGSTFQFLEKWSISGMAITLEAIEICLRTSTVYDDSIQTKIKNGMCADRLALELILEDEQ